MIPFSLNIISDIIYYDTSVVMYIVCASVSFNNYYRQSSEMLFHALCDHVCALLFEL